MRISDLSSDVCSSDPQGLKAARGEEDMRQHLASGHSAARCLAGIFLALICPLPASCTDSRDTITVGSKNFGESNVPAQMFAILIRRSEERRVGKACVSTCRSRR